MSRIIRTGEWEGLNRYQTTNRLTLKQEETSTLIEKDPIL